MPDPRLFPLPVVVSETAKNLRSAPVLASSTGVLVLLLGFIALAASILDVSAITARWEEKIARGASVWVVSTDRVRGLSAQRCDELNRVSTVVAAGGRLTSEEHRSRSLPGTRITIEEVTPGFTTILWPTAAQTDTAVTAGTTLATDLGVVAGGRVALEDTADVPVTRVASQPARIPAFDRNLVIQAAPEGAIDQCYVEAVPGATADVETVLTTWFPASPRTNVLPFVDPRTLGRDSQTELDERASRHVPVAAAVATVILYLFLVWARRKDFALYRLLGLAPGKLLLMLGTEFALVCLLPLHCGFALALTVLQARMGADPTIGLAVADALQLWLLTLPAPAIATALLIRAPLPNVLKGQ